MTNKKFLAVLLTITLLFALCGCTKSAEPTGTEPITTPAAATEQITAPATATEQITAPAAGTDITVSDMIGRQVNVQPGSYTHVVCIGAGALRMYTYICGSDNLCGVEDIDNLSLSERPKMFDATARPYVLAYGNDFTSLSSCGVGGPNAQTAEVEKILACNPDIIISEYEDAEKADAIEAQTGVPVITLKGSQNVFDEAFANSLALLGTIFGKSERAGQITAYINESAIKIADRVKSINDGDKPSAYICGLGNWGTTNHLMTSEAYPSFKIAGIKNAVHDTGNKGAFPIEEEAFVALGESMDIMFIDSAAVKNIKPLYAENPTILDSCKAWQNGEAYLQMAFNAYYTNYELAFANTWFVAKSVYPDQFSDIDMHDIVDEITEVFLQKKLADDIFACPASFGGYQKIDTDIFFK